MFSEASVILFGGGMGDLPQGGSASRGLPLVGVCLWSLVGGGGLPTRGTGRAGTVNSKSFVGKDFL